MSLSGAVALVTGASVDIEHAITVLSDVSALRCRHEAASIFWFWAGNLYRRSREADAFASQIARFAANLGPMRCFSNCSRR
jgi:hypothetical protein